ncbi:hypothetical protein HOD08_04965 [bacterium]|nr:hypothetical protein [bacterium]
MKLHRLIAVALFGCLVFSPTSPPRLFAAGPELSTGSSNAEASKDDFSIEELKRLENEAAEAAKTGSYSLKDKILGALGVKKVDKEYPSGFKIIIDSLKGVAGFIANFVKSFWFSLTTSDYMGRTLRIYTVNRGDPTKAEKVIAPKPKKVGSLGWSYKAQGVEYDFGFEGSGDPSEPLGFVIRDNKFYYRPVYAQMIPATVKIGKSTYELNLYRRPLSILLPKVLKSITWTTGDDEHYTTQKPGENAWDTMRYFGRLRPESIFFVKVMMLIRTALVNSGYLPKFDIYGKKTPSKLYEDAYPQVNDISGEIVKLTKRLAVTPAIEETVAANAGKRYPSSWDNEKVILIGELLGENVIKRIVMQIPREFRRLINQYTRQISARDFVEWRSGVSGIISVMKEAYSEMRLIRGYNAKTEYALEQLLPLGTNELARKDVSLSDLDLFAYSIRRHVAERFRGIAPLVIQQMQEEENRDIAVDEAPDDEWKNSINVIALKKLLDIRIASLAELIEAAPATLEKLNNVKWEGLDLRQSSGVTERISQLEGERAARNQRSIDLNVKFQEQRVGVEGEAKIEKVYQDYLRATVAYLEDVRRKLDQQVEDVTELMSDVQAAEKNYKRMVQGLSGDVNATTGSIDELYKSRDRYLARCRELINYIRRLEETEFAELPSKSPRTSGIDLSMTDYLEFKISQVFKLVGLNFRGDEGFLYNDSAIGLKPAFWHIMAIMFRAQGDLGKAREKFSQDTKPYTMSDPSGSMVEVVGKIFYEQSFQKYEKFLAWTEEELKKAQEAAKASGIIGTDDAGVNEAMKRHKGARVLYKKVRKELWNYLRQYPFDRRKRGIELRGDSGIVEGEFDINPTTGEETPRYTYARTINQFLVEEVAELMLRSRDFSKYAHDHLELPMISLTGMSMRDLLQVAQGRTTDSEINEIKDNFDEVELESATTEIDSEELDELMKQLKGLEGSDEEGPSLEIRSSSEEFKQTTVKEFEGLIEEADKVYQEVKPVVFQEPAPNPASPTNSIEITEEIKPPATTIDFKPSPIPAPVPEPEPEPAVVSIGQMSLAEVIDRFESDPKVNYNAGENYRALIDEKIPAIEKKLRRAQDIDSAEYYKEGMNLLVGLFLTSEVPSSNVIRRFLDVINGGPEGGVVSSLRANQYEATGVTDPDSFDYAVEVLTYLGNGPMYGSRAEIFSFIDRIQQGKSRLTVQKEVARVVSRSFR